MKSQALPERSEKFDSSGEIKKMIKVLPWEVSEGSEEEPMRDWQTLSHVKWDCKMVSGIKDEI
ncbi:hypothetical protein [Desulfocicer niacini]